MIQGLIFDFDGLILETEGPIYQSWQEIYQSYGAQLPLEQWGQVVGTAEEVFDPIAWLEQQLGRTMDRELLLSRQRQRERELIAAQPVRPGVQEYLQDAHRLGLKVGLASSATCSWVVNHLTRLGLLPYFDCIKAREDVHRTKPDPALYLATLTELGLSPKATIALEDSPNGILAAKRAGLFCVAVPNTITRHLPLDQADLRLESLSDLPLHELLKKFEL